MIIVRDMKSQIHFKRESPSRLMKAEKKKVRVELSMSIGRWRDKNMHKETHDIEEMYRHTAMEDRRELQNETTCPKPAQHSTIPALH